MEKFDDMKKIEFNSEEQYHEWIASELKKSDRWSNVGFVLMMAAAFSTFVYWAVAAVLWALTIVCIIKSENILGNVEEVIKDRREDD